MKEFLWPLFPPPSECPSFVDVFGGSAQVIMNLPYRYRFLTYNDIDSDVVNFFRCLRDRPDELIGSLVLTPYARDEFAAAVCEQPDDLDDVERARRFYIRARQTPGYGARQNLAPSHWLRAKAVNGAKKPLIWKNKVDGLDEFVDILRGIQIENRDAVNLLNGMDSANVFFYLDPPYVLDARLDGKDAYRHEMTDDDHRRLADCVKQCEGKVMLSGYHSTLYDELYADWHCIEDVERFVKSSNSAGGTPSVNRDVVWMNYQPLQKALL